MPYLTLSGDDGEVRVEPTASYACRQDVMKPDAEKYRRVHAATVAEAPGGDILTVFYGGYNEGSADQALYISRLGRGKHTWSAPEVVFDEPGKADGNPVLWSDGKRLYLFFATIFGHGWGESGLRLITSDDAGRTWSQPTWIRQEWGWMTGTQPIRMSNGELLLPIYDEEESTSGFYVFTPDLSSWQAFPEPGKWIRSPSGSIQPTVVELATPGHLLAYMRTGDGRIYQSESKDYARTWSAPVPHDIGNPNSRIAMTKLNTGKLVLAYNPYVQHRSPMRLSLSPDNGRTWENTVDVEAKSGPQFTYPALVQGGDGSIHLVYSNNRNTIRHVVFNEAYLKDAVGLISNYPGYTTTEFKNGIRKNVVDECSWKVK